MVDGGDDGDVFLFSVSFIVHMYYVRRTLVLFLMFWCARSISWKTFNASCHRIFFASFRVCCEYQKCKLIVFFSLLVGVNMLCVYLTMRLWYTCLTSSFGCALFTVSALVCCHSLTHSFIHIKQRNEVWMLTVPTLLDSVLFRLAGFVFRMILFVRCCL